MVSACPSGRRGSAGPLQFFTGSHSVVKERPARPPAAQAAGRGGREIGSGCLSAGINFLLRVFSAGTSIICFADNYRLSTGGAEGIRTHDILLAKQELYQMSYRP